MSVVYYVSYIDLNLCKISLVIPIAYLRPQLVRRLRSPCPPPSPLPQRGAPPLSVPPQCSPLTDIMAAAMRADRSGELINAAEVPQNGGSPLPAASSDEDYVEWDEPQERLRSYLNYPTIFTTE